LSVENISVFLKMGSAFLPVLQDVSFKINQGEVVGLVGESGCGKSMTSLAILGLLPEPASITDGAIIYNGTNLAKAPTKTLQRIRGAEISMIFQEPMTSLNPVMRISDQIIEMIDAHEDVSYSEAWNRAATGLKEVGIHDPEHTMLRYPHELSGGMKQRAMIAMALACKPKLLIADEPTTALDVTVQAQILSLLKSLQKSHQMSILLITHDLAVISEIADRALVMYAGEIVEAGPAQELFLSPKHPYTKGLIESRPTLAGSRTRLKTIPGYVPPIKIWECGCRFRERCEKALSSCGECAVQLKNISANRITRCIRVEESGL